MDNFESRLTRLKDYINEKYTVDVLTLDVIDSGVRYLYENISYLYENAKYQSDWGFAHIIYRALLEATRLGISEKEVWEVWMDIVYEDDKLLVKSTGQDYDFIATLEINEKECTRTGEDLMVVFTGEYDYLEPIPIPNGNWVGLLADEEGYQTLEAIKKQKFYTIWETDYEEEQS